MTPRLIRNRAKCLKCGDVIESKYRHDFVTCSCWSKTSGIFVDGGTQYSRNGYHHPDEYQDLCEWEAVSSEEDTAKTEEETE